VEGVQDGRGGTNTWGEAGLRIPGQSRVATYPKLRPCFLCSGFRV
jgi:hypothetical protein